MAAVQPPACLADLNDDLLRTIVSRLAESELASAVALKRCSSRFKDLAAPLVANAVSVTNEKWQSAASKIGGRVGAKIAGALERNEVLTSLDVGGNKIGPTGATAIAEALKGNGVLTDLNLSGNNIGGGTGWIKASEVEGESKEVGAKVIYQGREMVVSVGVDSDGELKLEDPTGVIAIAKALEVNAVLTKLNLDGHELDLPKLRGTDPVTSLFLSRKSLGSASAIVIASLIAGNGVLKILDIGFNKIGPKGAAAIAEGLRGNGVLTMVSISYNQIHDEGAVAIAEALRVNGVLNTLYIGCNKIGDEGAKAIGGALAVNGVLKTLNLQRNYIGDKGAAAIGEALRGNAVLKNIDLRYNSYTRLGDEGKGVIRDAVSGREGFKLEM